jgi:hypothetical protein
MIKLANSNDNSDMRHFVIGRLSVLCAEKRRSLEEQLNLFWQKLNILRKKNSISKYLKSGKHSFFILHSPSLRHSINEKGRYD